MMQSATSMCMHDAARPTTRGHFVTSDGFKPMEGEEGYYHLLVGMLSSLPNRVFTPLYGLVEIPAAALRIDKLISPDGEFVIDLVRKEIRGYKVSFTGGGASGGPDADTILEGILGQARSYTTIRPTGSRATSIPSRQVLELH